MVTNSEKNEKSLAEFLLIITLVGVMMSVFINFFIEHEAQYSQAGFKTMAQNFTTKVSVVHGQWIMDKHPEVVELAMMHDLTKQLISVNQQGWIDVNSTSLVCEKIWQLVMESPLRYMKQTIAAIEVRSLAKASAVETTSICRYALPNGTYFDYNRLNGRVTSVEVKSSAK
ncbi:MAG: hypothetical protein QF552_11565 [Litorilituus sp.]|jgi:hypothetical protein|nr:hypothetical protein [Litorilituus sp.]